MNPPHRRRTPRVASCVFAPALGRGKDLHRA